MSIQIEQALCRKCGKCMEVCPGNLIRRSEDGTAYIKRPQECWGCASCLKECGFGAISYFLGADIGGRGSRMKTTQDGDLTHWTITREGEEPIVITVDKRNANKY